MASSEFSAAPQPSGPSLPGELFPTLTPQQISRIAAIGRRRSIARGDLLVDVGNKVIPFFVILSGEIQALRALDNVETLNASLRAGQFSGEGSLLTGRRSMARLRVTEPGEVIELSREQLLALVQTDPELSEIVVGDVRAGNVKPVASAVGEGSIAVAFVHQVLKAT
jgi:thioredoxin reductase (NADPH)